MLLDLTKIPFSTYGSYIVLSLYEDGLYLRDIRGGDKSLGKLIKVDCYIDSTWIPIHDFIYQGTETFLTFSYKKSTLDIAFENEDTIRFKGQNIQLQLSYIIGSYDHVNIINHQEVEMHSYLEEVKIKTTFLKGTYEYGISWQGERTSKANIMTSDIFDIAFESYRDVSIHSVHSSFDEILENSFKQYQNWKSKMLSPLLPYDESFSKAAYITYSSIVKAEGNLPRYAMYMSKNWMTNIWSWDNCFNALGLATHLPKLAYDQFIMFKEMQLKSGVLPDFANNLYSSYACTKPPIQGWTYSLLLKLNPYFAQPNIMKESYEMMSNQMSYWETHRMDSLFQLPYYNHGNDSGMDNASVFHQVSTIISPDLASYMILQYEMLDELALKLSIFNTNWKEKANQLQSNLMHHLYDGKQFYSVEKISKNRIQNEHALINLMPIVIGHRLEHSVLTKLVSRLLSDEFYTSFGFATESIKSTFYESNGYWRGPIWAPTTLLIIDGLHRSGYIKESVEASKRFCDLTLIGGMAENFDSLTGQGLVDPAFTWTSNVFFVLAHYYVNEANDIYAK